MARAPAGLAVPGALAAPAGSTPRGLGDPNNPTSIAYFNQTVGDRVLFAVDQSTLSPEARGVLTAQANWLNQNPGYAAIIEGHADEQGTREYNLALGARRAAAVQNFLISQGVAANRAAHDFLRERAPAGGLLGRGPAMQRIAAR